MSTEPRRSRVVAVTGASGRIGRATARAFAASRTRVVLMADRDSRPLEGEGLRRAAEEVRAAGGTAVVLPLDVGDPTAVAAAVDRVEAEVGPIDVWVNAPADRAASDGAMGPADRQHLSEVGYLGSVYTTKAVLAPMVERDRGTVVQVSRAEAGRCAEDGPDGPGTARAIEGFHGSLLGELGRLRSRVHLAIVPVTAPEPEGTARAVVAAVDDDPWT